MKRILHSVIDKVYNWDNLNKASAKVLKNKGCAGVDGISVSKWKDSESIFIDILQKDLMNGIYRGEPTKRAFISKSGSRKKRPLGIPIIKDRVCQQAVVNVLHEVFDEYFHEDSYAYRNKRSTQTAARRVKELHREGYQYVLDLDIMGFFDHLDHEILMKLVKKVVKDRRVLRLIRDWLTAGVMEEGKIKYLTSGTPQGGVISPLLSNVYLTVLDNALEKAGYKFVRYADDTLIFCKSEEKCRKAQEYVANVLETLKLKLNQEKTKITSFKEGFDFLGFHFGRRSVGVGSKSLLSLYGKVREVTKRHQGDCPVCVIVKNLTPILRGWGNYHRAGQNIGIFIKLDKWVRKRLQSYVYKKWLSRSFYNKDKYPNKADFERMGLFSLINIIKPNELQLKLL